jgi:high affinity sulfate transporter 1
MSASASSTTTQVAQSKLPRLRLFGAIKGLSGADWSREILAGVTLAALMIPLNIGYAQVAGLPASVGLYAAIIPMLVFPLFCTSRHLVASPDAPVAALIGTLLGGIAAASDPAYVQLAYAQALVTAIIFVLIWFFRLGFLANFLSRAVLIGFISGLGIEVFTSQLKKIMGISVEADGYFRELWEIITSIPQANWYAVGLGVGTIIIIRLLKRYAPKLPGALIALLLMTAMVAIFNLDEKGVSVLGSMPSGLPSLTIPQIPLADYAALIPGALAICGITMAEGLLVARSYAQKYGEKIDPDQEMFAFGMTNLASGLSGGFFVGSSASRTAAMDAQGTRSQIPTMVAGVVVALVMLFLSGFLALLPNPVLGGIVANAVLALIEVGELQELFRVRRSEFWIAIICLLSVLVLGALPAVIIAFVLSTIDLVRRVADPPQVLLQALPDGTTDVTELTSDQAVTHGGLVVFRFGAPLYFANANVFQGQVEHLVNSASEPVQWFVLDAEAIDDIDTTGSDTLEHVIEFLRRKNIIFAMSRAHHPIPELLKTYELMEKIGEDRLYRTNRQAADAFYRETGVPPVSPTPPLTTGGLQPTT